MSERKFDTNWNEFLNLLDSLAVMSMEDRLSISNDTQTIMVPRSAVRDIVKLARAGLEGADVKKTVE